MYDGPVNESVVRLASERYQLLGRNHFRMTPPGKGDEEISAVSPGLRPVLDDVYDYDGLRTVHNHDFLTDARYLDAYRRGLAAGAPDYHLYWRLHLILWAGATALHVSGDFVECGVSHGFMSSALMEYLDWNQVGRPFWLFDTFEGLDAELVSPLERAGELMEQNARHLQDGLYASDVSAVRRNFAEWSQARVVKGSVPNVLEHCEARTVAFLHLDMNCAAPELEALDFFWPKMSVGGVIVLDDYAYYGYQSQKSAIDEWAETTAVSVATLPTGQGLVLKN